MLPVVRGLVLSASCSQGASCVRYRDDMLVTSLSLSGVVRLDQCQWIPMAEQAVCVIYRLAEHPDCICTHIIKHVAEAVLNNHEQGEPPEAAPVTPEEGNR